MKSKVMKPELQSGRSMLAGEAAKELGVGIQTLHFYEGQGLIPRPPRTASGYRHYTPEIIERVRFIRKAQALGFSLDEVKEILGLAKRGRVRAGVCRRRSPRSCARLTDAWKNCADSGRNWHRSSRRHRS